MNIIEKIYYKIFNRTFKRKGKSYWCGSFVLEDYIKDMNLYVVAPENIKEFPLYLVNTELIKVKRRLPNGVITKSE